MKLLSILLEAGMGAREYVTPTKPMQLMADFYILGFLESGPVHTPSERQSELDYEISNIKTTLIPALKQHLLYYVGFGIAIELHFILDDGALRKSKTRTAQQHIDGLIQYKHGGPPTAEMKYLETKLGIPRALLIELLSISPYDIDNNDAVFDASKCGACAALGLKIFDPKTGPLRWDERGPEDRMGGPVWASICQLWFDLYNAHTLNEISVQIDRVYDAQHIRGFLLNKHPIYRESWVKELLDLKFGAKEPEALIKYTSPHMRQVATQVLKARYGRGYNTDKWGTALDKTRDKEYTDQIIKQLTAAINATGLRCSDSGDWEEIHGSGLYHIPIFKQYEQLAEIDFNTPTIIIKTNPTFLKNKDHWNNTTQFDIEDQSLIPQAMKLITASHEVPQSDMTVPLAKPKRKRKIK